MACVACAKKKNGINLHIGSATNWQTIWNTGNFTIALYNGPAYPKLVGSPTGIITNFGFLSYGRRRGGDILIIHRDDVAIDNVKFTEISEDDDRYAETLLQYNVEPGFEEPEPVSTRSEAKEENKNEDVIELKVDDVILNVSLNDGEDVNPDETKDDNDNEILIGRENAILLTKFRDNYGFNHHLEVLGLVKAGDLLSYKDGKNTFIYHKEK